MFELVNVFTNIIIAFASVTSVTTPTVTSVLKLYDATSNLIEPYLLNVAYTDNISDNITIGGGSSSFIGYMKYFKIFSGSSAIWTRKSSLINHHIK